MIYNMLNSYEITKNWILSQLADGYGRWYFLGWLWNWCLLAT